MEKWIWFDCDGTFVDLYGVENWLDDLINERVRPYAIAKGLVNFNSFAKVLHKLQNKGYKIGIISWTAKNGSDAYNKAVTDTKKKYLKKHLTSVEFDAIDIIPYGTPKNIGRTGILFDDELNNRKAWGENAYDVTNLMTDLKALAA